MLIVPDVVLREVVRVYERTFRAHKRKLEAELGGFRRMGLLDAGDGLRLPADVTEARTTYEADVRRILGDANAEVHPLPTASHDVILRRSLDERKPMARGERGYRDTLLWETVLEVARHAHRVVLLTKNTQDFADEARLAAHLRDDLVREGYDDDRVSLFLSVAEFLETCLTPPVNSLQREIAALIVDYPDMLFTLAEHFASYLEYGFPVELGSEDAALWDASLMSFHGLDSLDLDDVAHGFHDLPVATFVGAGEAELEAFMEKVHYEEISDWTRPELLDVAPLGEVLRVSLSRVVTVTARLPYLGERERPFGDVVSIEVSVADDGHSYEPPQEEHLF